MATAEQIITRINAQGQITLPAAVRAAARLAPDADLSIEVAPDGSIVLRPTRDPEQQWFWTDAWQQMEREADASIAAGRVRVYGSDEEFLRALDELADDH